MNRDKLLKTMIAFFFIFSMFFIAGSIAIRTYDNYSSIPQNSNYDSIILVILLSLIGLLSSFSGILFLLCYPQEDDCVNCKHFSYESGNIPCDDCTEETPRFETKEETK